MSADQYDADAWRQLVVGLLDRIEVVATALRGDEDIDWAELGIATKATIGSIVDELGEILNTLLAQLISLLEALQAVLERTMTQRAEDLRESVHRTGFEPIAVQVNVSTGRPGV